MPVLQPEPPEQKSGIDYKPYLLKALQIIVLLVLLFLKGAVMGFRELIKVVRDAKKD